jgi:para-aminobenzoate synthetase component I
MRLRVALNSISNDELKAWLHIANQSKHVLFLNSNTANNSIYPQGIDYDWLLAFEAKELLMSNENSFNSLKSFFESKKDWLFGHFNYDLKNQVEALTSTQNDSIGFPELHFFQAKFVLYAKKNKCFAEIFEEDKACLFRLVEDVKNIKTSSYDLISSKINFFSSISKDEYIERFTSLQKHIQRGDIYEVNFCKSLIASAQIDSLNSFLQLVNLSPSPFSAYYKLFDKYAMCASPERYIQHKNKQLLSQPIKGTNARGLTEVQDKAQREKLLYSKKERSENVMIVDLVRNDLSRVAAKGSVRVSELFGVYPFATVNQMISSVEAELKEGVHPIDAIQASFPMGSMTGAPKISAMQLIEKHENFKRGLYSGSLGYIDPQGNFDFNVVIRTLLYNENTQQLMYPVGGAITALADANEEWDETELKARILYSLFH